MEMLDVWNSHGELTKVVQSRDECHRQGLWHQTAHIWVVNSQAEILLQQRQFDRESNPGKWDISAAGHIPAGQSALNAALRELYEEIGLNVEAQDLEYLGRVKHTYSQGPQWTNREYQEIYLYRGDHSLSELDYQKEEVNALIWLPLSEFWAWVDGETPRCLKDEGGELVTHPREYALMREILS